MQNNTIQKNIEQLVGRDESELMVEQGDVTDAISRHGIASNI